MDCASTENGHLATQTFGRLSDQRSLSIAAESQHNYLSTHGGAENDGHENDGPSKLQGMKMQDMKMTEQIAGHEN